MNVRDVNGRISVKSRYVTTNWTSMCNEQLPRCSTFQMCSSVRVSACFVRTGKLWLLTVNGLSEARCSDPCVGLFTVTSTNASRVLFF